MADTTDRHTISPRTAAEAFRRPRGFVGRAIVVSLLLLVQSLLIVVGAPIDAAGSGRSDIVYSDADRNCDAQAHGGAPARHRDHSHCCGVLCESQARAGLAVLAASVVETAGPAPAAIARSGWRVSARSTGRPLGWTSSWSSRAPPVFS